MLLLLVIFGAAVLVAIGIVTSSAYPHIDDVLDDLDREDAEKNRANLTQ